MPPSKRKEITPPETSEPTIGPSTPSGVSGATTAPPSDETDVQAAKDSETQDGPGEGPPPPSDFDSFATAGVHAEEKTIPELASEVLEGRWGDFSVLRGRLDDAGHDSNSVIAKVNERMTRGAPSAFHASIDQIVDQYERGEWGDFRALESRLLGAGYKAFDVAEVMRKIQKP